MRIQIPGSVPANTAARAATLAALLALAIAPVASAQSGGSFDLSWHTTGRGGTTSSSGGSFTLGGTIGQTVAGTLAGGTFQLTGGFWQGVALFQLVDVPDAPVTPPRAALTLRGFAGNPASLSRLQVSFSLANAEPARLQMFDVSGRRVADASVGALGPGAHVVELDEARGAAPGLYWLRLAQSGRALVVRSVLIE